MRGFFRCWTLKEAYIKARGGGLSIPLESFDVPLDRARDAPRPIVSRDAAPEAQGWYARELAVDGAFAAAVAVHAPIWRVLDCGSIELKLDLLALALDGYSDFETHRGNVRRQRRYRLVLEHRAQRKL